MSSRGHKRLVKVASKRKLISSKKKDKSKKKSKEKQLKETKSVESPNHRLGIPSTDLSWINEKIHSISMNSDSKQHQQPKINDISETRIEQKQNSLSQTHSTGKLKSKRKNQIETNSTTASQSSKFFGLEVLKILLVGSIGVGKTTFALRCQTNRYQEFLDPTVDYEIHTFKRVLNGQQYQIMLYDYQGSPSDSILHSNARHVHCAMIFYDSTEKGHCSKVSDILTSLSRSVPTGLPLILVETKIDLISLLKRHQLEQLEKDRMGMEILNSLVTQLTNSNSESQRELSGRDNGDDDNNNVSLLHKISSKTGEGVEELLDFTITESVSYKKSIMILNDKKSADLINYAKKQTDISISTSVSKRESPSNLKKVRLTPLTFKKGTFMEDYSSDFSEEENDDPWWYWLDCCGVLMTCYPKENVTNRTNIADHEIRTEIERNSEYNSEEDEVEIENFCP